MTQDTPSLPMASGVPIHRSRVDERDGGPAPVRSFYVQLRLYAQWIILNTVHCPEHFTGVAHSSALKIVGRQSCKRRRYAGVTALINSSQERS